MNKLFAFALAAAALAITSIPAEAHEYCRTPSDGYRTPYRRVVVVEPAYRWHSTHSYRGRSYRNRYEARSCERHDYHHRTHGVRGIFRRAFR